jgi:hypothetical protein
MREWPADCRKPHRQFESPLKFCYIKDLLVVQGVSSELVSARFPCYAGKIQGIFAIPTPIESLDPV